MLRVRPFLGPPIGVMRHLVSRIVRPLRSVLGRSRG
jgi:hypothetical protein